MPLSEERYTSGVGGVLQSFRNLVLLYDPTQAPPFDVRGEPLGKSAWAQLVPSSAAQPATACLSASCQFFPETGHTLSEPFATFWNDYGGAQIFGPPVSEPFEDPGSLGATVQVFESAVLENRAGTVALRPMGQWLAERDGLLTDPVSARAADRRQLLPGSRLRRLAIALSARTSCRGDGDSLA